MGLLWIVTPLHKFDTLPHQIKDDKKNYQTPPYKPYDRMIKNSSLTNTIRSPTNSQNINTPQHHNYAQPPTPTLLRTYHRQKKHTNTPNTSFFHKTRPFLSKKTAEIRYFFKKKHIFTSKTIHNPSQLHKKAGHCPPP